MNIKYRLIFLLAFGVILWKSFNHFNVFSDDRQTVELSKPELKEVIRITIFYEALCSDSRNFIVNQLAPTYEELHEHMSLEFVPYGKAKTHEDNGIISFTCQHGNSECIANKIHACVIDIYPEERMQLKFITCMIYDNIVPHEALERCGKELGVEYNTLIDCSNTKTSDLLLRQYGIQTDSVIPRITFIPTIQFDAALDVKQSLVLKDFRNVLCSLYKNKPKACL